jgi:hypothetical protein
MILVSAPDQIELRIRALLCMYSLNGEGGPTQTFRQLGGWPGQAGAGWLRLRSSYSFIIGNPDHRKGAGAQHPRPFPNYLPTCLIDE